MNNLEILKHGYKAFASGNVEAAISNWSDDIIWEECIGLPYVKGDGTYVGKQSVVENILAPIPELYDNFNIEISDFVDGGDRIVMVGHYAGTWKATGKKFRANATHTWSFENGKATHFIQAVDTATIIN
jgi:ketosteroid isomerase-like protein